jgi:cytochrome c-type biogenesis protein CcmH
MSRWLGWVTMFWLLAVCAVALVAYGSPSTHSSLDDRTRGLALQLRCPVCQGESVADSPSDLARAMRGEIRRRLADGQSSAQITAFFVSKYGNFILLSPPSSGIGGLAWLAPPLLLICGLGLIITLVLDWNSRGAADPRESTSDYRSRLQIEMGAGDHTE